MFHDPLFILVVIAVLVTLFILMLGIGSFGFGGKFHANNANRLMRYRIAAQAVAILCILIFVYFRR
ncbi:twin transmembrane helix small protein [Solirhodobacter olei]|uniref:twin transmembrane helix small protein n=1 Tax=Solirhodobacter olei TaxID=2493082 RepID=UPI000FDB12B0|nr:twin transmembrane helix small protein [Solirhodobacter olei]